MSALYRLKNMLVRRFDCVSIKDKTDKVVVEFKYKNYLMFNIDLFALRIQNKTVPTVVKKIGTNRVRVEIVKELLNFESNETFIKINCFYNGKKLWVRNKTKGTTYLTLNNQLCEFECTKNMYIKSLNDEYSFVNEKVSLKPYLNESNFNFQTDSKYNFTKILLINGFNKTEIPLQAAGKSNYTIPINEIESLAMEKYKAMYLVSDNFAYRAKFDNKYSFNLYHYYIEINKNSFFVFHKVFKAKDIIINESPDKYGFIINLKNIGNDQIKEYHNFVLLGNDNEIIGKYSIKTYGNKLVSKIPYGIFTETRANKNLYIEAIEKDTDRKVIYSIKEQDKE